jgi:predicted metallopeptidase
LLKFKEAPDVHLLLREIVEGLEFNYINPELVICYRSEGTKSDQVHARCWSLPRIWQKALEVKPHYVIEVISEKYDGLSLEDKKKLLIHELLHIPKSFKGGLRPHKGYVNSRIVNKLFKQLEDNQVKRKDFGIRFF